MKIIFSVRIYIYKYWCLLLELSILTLVCLIIVSNQFMLVRLVRNGQQDIEFKQLADWYIKNANPGEKIAVYMCGTVKVFAPKYAEYFVQFPKANSPEELVKACYDEKITYVVWATREGLSKDHYGYHKLKLDTNIAVLRNAKDIWPYQFITQIGSRKGFINVFRLLCENAENKISH